MKILPHLFPLPVRAAAVLTLVGLAALWMLLMPDASSAVPQAGPLVVKYVGQYDDGDEIAVAVAAKGNYAYVGYEHRLAVVNVSNPVTPTLAGDVTLPSSSYTIQDVKASGNYVYVTTSGIGWLWVFDVSNPANPREAGHLNLSNDGHGLAIGGNYAYVTSNYDGLRVINISTPSALEEIGYFDPDNSSMQDVALAGSYAYTVDNNYLRIINVSSPSAPLQATTYPLGSSNDIVVASGYAYVGRYDSIQIIDISNPQAVNPISSYYTSGAIQDMAISGSYVYMGTTDYWSNLKIADVSQPFSPSDGGSYDTSGNANGVAVSGSYIYIADGYSGLTILQAQPPTPTPTITRTPTDTRTPTVTLTPSITPTPSLSPTVSRTPTIRPTGTPVKVHLPLALQNYITYYTDTLESEPNNDYQHANGPLVFDQTYYGYPNDAKDYFSFYMPESGKLTIDVEKYTAHGAQLLLYYQTPVAGKHVKLDNSLPYHIEHTGPAGWYYLYIYAAGNYNDNAYTLRPVYTPAGNASRLSAGGESAGQASQPLTPTPPAP